MSSQRRKPLYDRFADTRLGGALLKWTLSGIDKRPSFLQRAVINTAIGSAYTADYAIQAARRLGSSFQPPALPPPNPTMSSGGAGAGGAFKRYRGGGRSGRDMRERNRRPYGFMELGGRQQQHVRGKGVMRGKYKGTPAAVRYNRRMHQNAPVTVSHQARQELRSSPGTQAVLTMISERRLPKGDYTGRLIDAINVDSTGANIDSTLGRIRMYTSRASDTTTQLTLNHRLDWTMFTNGSWRDGYAFANGQLNTANLMQNGYTSPYRAAAGDLYGTPGKWYEAPTSLIDPSGATREAVVEEAPDAPSANASVMAMTRGYYHLYEEISWRFMNNSVTGTTVTIYECVLNRDMPLMAVPGLTNATVEWGGLPCPLELWRQSQALRAGLTGALTADGDLYLTDGPGGAGATSVGPVDMGQTLTQGTAGVAFHLDPVTGAGATYGAQAKDIDYPNVTPHKAALLHTYYKVIPHTRYLPPGASTTITIGVKYNKCIPAVWWNTMYGVAGKTRTFFMASRPDEVVGVTNGDELPDGPIRGVDRTPVMNATDLMVSWTKKKTVMRSKQKSRHTWFYKAAIPEIDDVAMRNPVTWRMHDADAAMGTLAEEPIEGEVA